MVWASLVHSKTRSVEQLGTIVADILNSAGAWMVHTDWCNISGHEEIYSGFWVSHVVWLLLALSKRTKLASHWATFFCGCARTVTMLYFWTLLYFWDFVWPGAPALSACVFLRRQLPQFFSECIRECRTCCQTNNENLVGAKCPESSCGVHTGRLKINKSSFTRGDSAMFLFAPSRSGSKKKCHVAICLCRHHPRARKKQAEDKDKTLYESDMVTYSQKGFLSIMSSRKVLS